MRAMRFLLRLVKVVVSLVLLLALVAVGLLYWASRGYDADAVADAPVTYDAVLGQQGAREPPAELRVLAFNIAYGRGPVDDLGDRREEREVRAFLSAIATFLRGHDADIVALQEVDFGAARTYHLDQLEWLAREAGYPHVARVTTWRANYVPHPLLSPRQHLGKMHSGQAVMSRFPLTSNRRVVLPQPEANPFWYNLFYLHRAIQVVTVQIGAQEVTVFNCHLEAFDQPNREAHGERVVALVRELSPERWVVLGDMNAPPPEAPQRSNFADEPGWDASTDRTIEILRAGLGVLEAPGLEAYEQSLGSTFTFPADAPTRRLDYVFASPSLTVVQARVVTEAGAISDHLPVAATLRLGEPDLPTRRAVPLPATESSR
jgi:endonuclease/exonuclease/phosphatase family metal-dependent hydrolase